MNEKTILLVEDADDYDHLTRSALHATNVPHRLVIARNVPATPAQLQNIAQDIPGFPALVLLDLNLPTPAAMEVIRQFRTNDRTKLLPVVILTTSDNPSGRICSLAFFVNSYIRKPHDFDRFVELMREVCRYWLMLNERPEPHKSYDTTQGIDHRGLPG